MGFNKKFNSELPRVSGERSKVTPEDYGLNPELAKSCFEEDEDGA